MGGRLPAARLALAAADVSTSGSTGHVTMFCCISASRPFRTSEAGRLVRSTRSLSEVGPLLRRKEERVSIDSEKSVSMTCFATARCSAATKWEGGALICQSDERGRCDAGGGHGGTPKASTRGQHFWMSPITQPAVAASTAPLVPDHTMAGFPPA